MSALIRDIFGLTDAFLVGVRKYKPGVFLAGAELEIEAVRDWHHSWVIEEHINVENDGSLRNNGKEFLLPPSDKERLIKLFSDFHGSVELGKDPFSPRTSTHVHINCIWSTEQQVKNLLYLYAIFEPIFFAFAGSERKENIHCMPLSSTHMPNHYSMPTRHIIEKWHKYTALNLLPLSELGTVEFRHLYGTNSVDVFGTWIDMIETLWTAAQDWGTFGVDDLINLDKLRAVERKLLSLDYYACTKENPQYVLEDNLLDVKLAFL